MIFQNPWAWIGAAAIAVPIVVHLLTRQRVDRTPFPTLRFLPALPLTTVKRYRLTDLALLAVRCAVLIAATWALAQPYVVTAARRHASTLSRAIAIDTSASMSRQTPGGGPALGAARQRIAALEPHADTTTIVEGAKLPEAIAGAAAWLDRAAGRRELVIASDFQRGTLGPNDLAGLASDITVRALKIDVVGSAETLAAPAVSVGGATLVPGLNLLPDRTDVQWTTTPVADPARPATASIQVFASADERPYADAALQSARDAAIPMSPALAPSVAIVLPGAPERAALRSAAHDLDERWMFDLVARIRRDPLLSHVNQAHVSAAPAAATLANTPTLLLFLEPDDRVVHAAVIAAAARHLAAAADVDELETSLITADDLARWTDPGSRRDGPDSAQRGIPPDASDGRWFWGLALVLLGVETVMRRRSGPSIEISHERAAA